MKKDFGVLSVLLAVGAVVIMFLPTYTLVFGAEGGVPVPRSFPWWDPILLGYGEAVPALSLACGVVMVAGLVAGLVFARAPGWIAVAGLVAATLLLLFAYDTDSAGFVTGAGQFVAPLIGVAAVLGWARARRRPGDGSGRSGPGVRRWPQGGRRCPRSGFLPSSEGAPVSRRTQVVHAVDRPGPIALKPSAFPAPL